MRHTLVEQQTTFLTPLAHQERKMIRKHSSEKKGFQVAGAREQKRWESNNQLPHVKTQRAPGHSGFHSSSSHTDNNVSRLCTLLLVAGKRTERNEGKHEASRKPNQNYATDKDLIRQKFLNNRRKLTDLFFRE